MADNSLWRFKKGFILASASVNRLGVLKQLRLEPDRIVVADVDEGILSDELPSAYVKRIATLKAKAVREKCPEECIVAADTVLAVGRRIIRKATTEEQARQNLLLLSGRRHQVLTGLCVITPQGQLISKVVRSRVTMAHLDEQDIRVILDSKEWVGVAGYRIDGVLSAFVRDMSGSYSSIIGLPAHELVRILNSALR